MGALHPAITEKYELGLFTPCQYTGASSGHENPLPSGCGTCELIYIHG